MNPARAMAERATGVPARVVALWRSEGVALNAPATGAELDVLGKLLGVLPDGGLVALFSLANGMVDDVYDARFVSFWSIAKIERNRKTLSGGAARVCRFRNRFVVVHSREDGGGPSSLDLFGTDDTPL